MADQFWAHPKALVETDQIGSGTRVWAFAHVMEGAKIGSRCNIGEHVFVEKGAVIGNNVTVKNGVQVWEGVVLEDDVFVGPSAVFCNDRYPRSPRSEAAGDRYKAHDWCEGVVVGHGASIGANATVVCGVRIGRYALVAAGAVVTRSAPDFALVMGAPGRAAGWVCMCGRTLLGEGEMRCEACGRGYVEQGGALVNRA